MQLKAAELIGNIRKAGSKSQALYMQLAGMTDELAGARYARFINKRFSELGAQRAVRKERGAEKRFKIAGLPRGAYDLKQFDLAPNRRISRQTLAEMVECRWIAKRVPHQRRDNRRDGQSIANTGATSFLTMVINCEAIERGFNVRYWSLSELAERLSKAEKNLRR